MKRSDMVRHVTNAIELNEIYGIEDLAEQANMLLKVIEAHGMLPPCQPWKDELSSIKEAYSWEAEDEKK